MMSEFMYLDRLLGHVTPSKGVYVSRANVPERESGFSNSDR